MKMASGSFIRILLRLRGRGEQRQEEHDDDDRRGRQEVEHGRRQEGEAR